MTVESLRSVTLSGCGAGRQCRSRPTGATDGGWSSRWMTQCNSAPAAPGA